MRDILSPTVLEAIDREQEKMGGAIKDSPTPSSDELHAKNTEAEVVLDLVKKDLEAQGFKPTEKTPKAMSKGELLEMTEHAKKEAHPIDKFVKMAMTNRVVVQDDDEDPVPTKENRRVVTDGDESDDMDIEPPVSDGEKELTRIKKLDEEFYKSKKKEEKPEVVDESAEVPDLSEEFPIIHAPTEEELFAHYATLPDPSEPEKKEAKAKDSKEEAIPDLEDEIPDLSALLAEEELELDPNKQQFSILESLI